MGRYALYGFRDVPVVVEEFPATCHRCRRTVPHARVEITRRRTIFYVALHRLGVSITTVSCRSCGNESHIRDVPELASPTQIARYTFALRGAVARLVRPTNDGTVRAAAIAAVSEHYSVFTGAELDADLAARVDDQLLDALRDLEIEAGPHITERFLGQLVPVAAATAPDRDAVIRRLADIAAALNVNRHRLDVLVAATLAA